MQTVPKKPSVKFECESENIYYDSQINSEMDENPIYESEPVGNAVQSTANKSNPMESPYEIESMRHAAQNPIYESGSIEDSSQNPIYETEPTGRTAKSPYEIEPIRSSEQNPIYESEQMKSNNNDATNTLNDNNAYEDPWESRKTFPRIEKEDVVDGGIESLYADVIKPSKRK